jgi:hypothetical protein
MFVNAARSAEPPSVPKLRGLIVAVIAIAAISILIGRSAAAETPPAPPLDMREYRDYAKHGRADSTFSAKVILPTKLLGNVTFYSFSKIFLMIDTSYSRWVMDAYRDFYVGDTTKTPAVDKAIYDGGWIVPTSIDTTGTIAYEHLVSGSYIVFGGVQLRTGTPQNSLAATAGYSAEGIETTVPIPTLTFTNVKSELLYFVIPFQVTSEHSSVTGTPQVIADRLFQ